MKKLLLLLSAAIIGTTLSAQQRTRSVLFDDGSQNRIVAPQPAPITIHPDFKSRHRPGNTERTTSGTPGRWYNYGDYLSAQGSPIAFSANYLWNDTTSVDAYTGTTGNEYLFNTIVSVGMVCDPFIAGWNDAITYAGMMSLSTADAYTIDSVFISGVYQRNDAKTTPVDTLTLAVIYGDGTTATDLHAVARDTIGGNGWIYTEYGVDTLHYMRMPHDSINNHADTFDGGVTPVVSKIYLTNLDTSSNYQAVIPVSINVPAGGNLPAVSLSFKSGDPMFTFGDTVFAGSGASAVYKYGMFRATEAYVGTTSSPEFPSNLPNDRNQGQFRYEGYGDPHHIYTPQWFWSASGGAAALQYPYFAFHITCATCELLGVNNTPHNISKVNAVPNPANNALTINFALAAAADVSVSLTNVMGQVVAAQHIANTAGGKAVFNTAVVPAGIYFYTVVANGERSAGRIVVSH